MRQSELSLPPGCELRRATSQDMRSLRRLVFSAMLDPTQLHWQQFWVIEFQAEVIACGQLRNFSQAQELGSLVVKPNWRGRGIATFLTHYLITQATQPLYLECLGQRLAQFYSHFGFVQVDFENLPKSLQNKFKISQLGKKILRVPVIFMQHQGEATRNQNS
ncbi:GNAT family N-acetyltransferase [Nostoc sp. CENA543]|uniref:GNAT family N-acetyltransferase n=1 Tax=Nostoc sp. CENA543 TaxID=1869241 RepID=UPI000CA1C9E0|nr:GNAT family N-acetyltransferase [Nostoc sp. CENA543]AUT03604.1 GNAT family N-acetyltransferase [Nostoc sp. CENA543]